MTTLLNASTALLALGATVLTALAAVAWHRSGRARMGVLALGFACFAAAGVATAIGLYRESDPVGMLTVQTLLVSLGLLIVYLAAVKR